MSVGELPSSPASARDELQAQYNDLLALQDQTDQVPLAKALDAVGLALSLLGHAQRPAVTDEMVERAWAGIVGRDIADICHNASVVRGDIRAALVAALADTSTQQAPRTPKVRTSHHRNKEEAARLQELVDKRLAVSDTSTDREGK